MVEPGEGLAMEGHPVSYSKTTITELMIPSYANFGGKIHGGTLLSLMDKVAYACASKHAGAYCVTVAVGAVNFLQPVEVGELVSMLASVNYVGRTSLVVGIKVIAENVQTGVVKHTNTSYFTLVAKADDGELVPVPPLILETAEDVRRFHSAALRQRLRKELFAKMDAHRANFVLNDKVRADLAGERCVILVDGAA
ncbi:acyl-CoA thioesterase [Pseudohaliea rubra]|uniref:Acyl CoA thioester hydrolase family protein n=1 Tax=Pseudohaliea rubra DSM 19751 TaxID=1265313 RepID=A0A095VMN4_9GAMM|nr:acyl-CoA thioesterase [Pseudohaliea rubra]KGE02615.1 acyl CoA thioester hydrolase family protein [Pseudohaliea rubra DSM 19751]